MRGLWELVTAREAEHWRRWYVRWLLVAGGALLLAIAAALVLNAPAVADGPTPAYTTGHPGKPAPWLGLAAQDGRYEVLLADACEAIGADMNVMLTRSDGSNEATWTLQVPDSDQVCRVAEWHWMGNAPCETNPDGVCDVGYS